MFIISDFRKINPIKSEITGRDSDFTVKLIGKKIKPDVYQKAVDVAIFEDMLNDKHSINIKTYNFAQAQLERAEFLRNQEIYSKVLARFFEDFEAAVNNNAPKEVLGKITNIIDKFILKEFLK